MPASSQSKLTDVEDRSYGNGNSEGIGLMSTHTRHDVMPSPAPASLSVFNVAMLTDASLNGPRSILRVVKVFAALAAHPDGRTLAQLCADLALPKTTLFTMLKVLAGAGYLSSSDGVYRLGPEAISLGAQMVESPRRNFPECARPILQKLSERTQETCYLEVLTPDRLSCRYVASVETENWLRFTVKLDSIKPVYATGSGRAMLAYMPPAELAAILKITTFNKVTSKTISSKSALIASLKEVRRICVSTVDSGTVDGVTAVAAPIFGADGSVMAAVTVGGPTARLSQRLSDIQAAVRVAAEDTSRSLGFRGQWPAVHAGAR